MTIQLSDLDLINIEQIKRFPNRQGSHIKSYKGQLAITGESMWERASAWSGTSFPETVQVIKNTCSKVLEMMSALPRSKEVLEKIEEMQQGLINIKQVYSVRYGRESVTELNDLESQIKSKIKEKFPSPSVITDQEEDWEIVPNDVRGSSRFELRSGEVPGFMASVSAGVKTAVLLSRGGGSVDPRSRVLNPGMQFSSADVRAFIENVGIEEPFHVVTDFYLNKRSGINIHRLAEIKALLDQQTIEAGSAIIIPINFMSQEVFGRNHIAVIVIKDNTVEYYDAKGVYSSNRQLADDHTLREVIAYCQQKWTRDGRIVENSYPHQTDANNCGMFVCKRLQEIFRFKKPLGVWETEGPSIAQIQLLRKSIADIAYPDQSLAAPSMDAEDEISAMLRDSTEDDFSFI